VADADVQAGRCEEALAFVRPFSDADPDDFDFQACILAGKGIGTR
jgi:hypothetical protein